MQTQVATIHVGAAKGALASAISSDEPEPSSMTARVLRVYNSGDPFIETRFRMAADEGRRKITTWNRDGGMAPFGVPAPKAALNDRGGQTANALVARERANGRAFRSGGRTAMGYKLNVK